MADAASIPPLRTESYHVPAHEWQPPPGLRIRPHYLARQRQQSETGPASDDDQEAS